MEFPEGGNPLKDASCYLDQWRVLIPSWCRTFHGFRKLPLWKDWVFMNPGNLWLPFGNHIWIWQWAIPCEWGVDGNRIYQLASFLSIVSLAYQRFKNHMTHMFSAFIFGSFECWSSNHLTERTRIPNSMHRQATCRWLPAIPKATPDARCFAQRFGL